MRAGTPGAGTGRAATWDSPGTANAGLLVLAPAQAPRGPAPTCPHSHPAQGPLGPAALERGWGDSAALVPSLADDPHAYPHHDGSTTMPNAGSSPMALKAHSGASYSAAPVSGPAVGQPWGSWTHRTGQAKWLPAGQELAWASKATQQSKVRAGWGLPPPPLCLLPSTQTTLPRIMARPYRSPSLWPWSQATRCLRTPTHPPATVPCHGSQHTVPTPQPQPHGPWLPGTPAGSPQHHRPAGSHGSSRGGLWTASGASGAAQTPTPGARCAAPALPLSTPAAATGARLPPTPAPRATHDAAGHGTTDGWARRSRPPRRAINSRVCLPVMDGRLRPRANNRQSPPATAARVPTVLAVEADLHLALLGAQQRLGDLGGGTALGAGPVEEVAGAGLLHHLRPRVPAQLAEAVVAVDHRAVLHPGVGDDELAAWGRGDDQPRASPPARCPTRKLRSTRASTGPRLRAPGDQTPRKPPRSLLREPPRATAGTGTAGTPPTTGPPGPDQPSPRHDAAAAPPAHSPSPGVAMPYSPAPWGGGGHHPRAAPLSPPRTLWA